MHAQLASRLAATCFILVGLYCLISHLQPSWVRLDFSAGAAEAEATSSGTETRGGGLLRLHAHSLRFQANEKTQLPVYIPKRAMPLGFDRWVSYAREHKCELRSYDRIEQDLEPFRKKGGISLEAVEMAKQVAYTTTFRIRNGSITHYQMEERPELNAAGLAIEVAILVELIADFVEHLPDMEFVVSMLDEPLVLPGTATDLSVRYDSPQCQNASQDFHDYRQLHGFIISPTYDKERRWPSGELVPVFTRTKISDCHADIIYPALHPLSRPDDAVLSAEDLATLKPWHQRNNTLFFRGSTTGGVWLNDEYRWGHRQRLVALAGKSTNMDMQFTEFVQCLTEVCDAMELEYGSAPRVNSSEVYDYKYLMAVDGMTFISRLPTYLSSGSLVFRAGLFSEWFDERIKPFEHYIPVKLDFSDLAEKLQWALDNDEEAAQIAIEGQKVAISSLRRDDMQCYLFRLLLEYGTLLLE